MASRDIRPILKSLRGITADVGQEADRLMKAWRPRIDRDTFRPSAQCPVPGGVAHFALTKAEPVVVDITGFGPTNTVYVNAANDPSNK